MQSIKQQNKKNYLKSPQYVGICMTNEGWPDEAVKNNQTLVEAKNYLMQTKRKLLTPKTNNNEQKSK